MTDGWSQNSDPHRRVLWRPAWANGLLGVELTIFPVKALASLILACQYPAGRASSSMLASSGSRHLHLRASDTDFRAREAWPTSDLKIAIHVEEFCSAPNKMHNGLLGIWSTELMIWSFACQQNSDPHRGILSAKAYNMHNGLLLFWCTGPNWVLVFSPSQHGARISDPPPHFRAESEPTRCGVFRGRHHRDVPGRPQPRVLEHGSEVAENHLRNSGCRRDLSDRVDAQPEASRGRGAHVFVRESAPWIQQRLHQVRTRRRWVKNTRGYSDLFSQKIHEACNYECEMISRSKSCPKPLSSYFSELVCIASYSSSKWNSSVLFNAHTGPLSIMLTVES